MVALALLVMMMFVIVMVALALLVMMMFVIVVVALALLIVMVMMVVVMLCLLGQMRHLGGQRIVFLHGIQNNLAVKGIPGGGDNGSLGIMLAKKRHGGGQLFLVHARGSAENDGTRIFDLVTVKLAKVLHVDAALGGIGYRNKTVENHIVRKHTFHRADNIGKFAHARGLDENAVRVELTKHLAKRLGEVTHKAATDATAVHFGNLNARLFEESAVNTDLTELIFDKNGFFACICFRQKFFDQRGFARAQKAREYINFCHIIFPSLMVIDIILYFITILRFFQWHWQTFLNLLRSTGKKDGRRS